MRPRGVAGLGVALLREVLGEAVGGEDEQRGSDGAAHGDEPGGGGQHEHLGRRHDAHPISRASTPQHAPTGIAQVV